MHPAVELLLKRMESNPDEFVKGNERRFKWEKIIKDYMEYMTDEEKTHVKQKYSELQMDVMHKEIMSELLHGEEQDEDPFKPVPHRFTAPFGELDTLTVTPRDRLRSTKQQILDAYEEYKNEEADRLRPTLFRSKEKIS